MNIEIIVTRFLPAKGGIIYYVLYLASYLLKLGYNIEIHTGNMIHIGKKRVLINHYKYRNEYQGKKQLIKNIRLIIEKDILPIAPLHVRIYKKSNADVLNVHGHAELFTFTLLPFLRKHEPRKPVVLTSHGSIQESLIGENIVGSPSKNMIMTLKKLFARNVSINLLKNYPDIIIASSYEEKDLLLSSGFDPRKVVVIENFVPDWFFKYRSNDVHALEILDKYGIEPYRYVITVSRIDHNKSLDQVIKALAFLHNQGIRNIKYLIIGPDEGALSYLLYLSNKLGIKKNIIYLGPITDRKTILTLDRYSLAFVYPIRYGAAHSLAVLEAESQATPIIVSNTLNSICKHVDHHVNGLVFRYGDIRSLAFAIRTLLEDKNLRKRLSKNTFEHAYKNHRLSRAVNEYAKIFNTLYNMYY